MAVFNNILAGASGATGAAAFQIDRSLRFNKSDSAHLYRQITTKGNTKTFTFSCWLKKTRTGLIDHNIFSGSTGTDTGAYLCIPDNSANALGGADSLVFKSDNDAGGGSVQTDAIFRDLSAWYHVVLAVDTTQATASDRVKIWVNGVSQTLSQSASPGYPNQDSELSINDVGHAAIGAEANGSSSSVRFLGSFYLAEIHFLDGTAVSDASDFGEYDSNNVWQPKEVSGVTYGTNGFHLDFSDNSSTTALGNDSSGNDNDWTVNNFAVTGFGWPSTTWSDDISIDSGNYYLNNNDGPNGFDGNSTTYIDCRLGTGANNTTNIIWAPTGGISGVTKIRVHSNYATHYRINEGTWTTFNSQGSYTQIYSGSAFTLTKLEVRRNDNGGTDYGHRVTAYELNDIEVRDNLAQSGDESGIDSLIDTPTNYTASSGNNGGNYATFNPLKKSGGVTLANGNLDVSVTSGDGTKALTTIGMSSGKWYAEFTPTSGNLNPGLATDTTGITSNTAFLGDDAGSWTYAKDGKKYHNDSSAVGVSYGDTYTDGDVIGVAFDADGGNLYFYKNGTVQNSGTAAYTGLTSGPYFFASGGSSSGGNFNAGQRPFAYTPPTGFVSLCTTNLPDPTIADGSTAFDIDLYTGTGSTHERSNFSFNPDLVWIKNRSSTYEHLLFDSVRGATKYIKSNSTAVEQSNSNVLTSFDNDGFTLGNDNEINKSSLTYCAWAWDAGTSTVSNTDGSITSSVRANQTAGFSIVSYTGDGNNATIGHGLNAAPEFIIQKRRNEAQDWNVYHSANGKDKSIILNTTAASYSSTTWNNTAPTSSVFSIVAVANPSGKTHIAYCFAPVEGYSAFGSYTGNGSADGPFIFTGFKVAFLITKRTDSSTSGDWNIVDTTRGTYNPVGPYFYANQNTAEGDVTIYDLLSNGFKIRESGAGTNANNSSYIYMAFAEHPFKTARAR